jgi:hypothetical protein
MGFTTRTSNIFYVVWGRFTFQACRICFPFLHFPKFSKDIFTTKQVKSFTLPFGDLYWLVIVEQDFINDFALGRLLQSLDAPLLITNIILSRDIAMLWNLSIKI